MKASVSSALAERYRPSCLSEVVGQGAVVAQLRRLEQAGKLLGRAYWVSGPSGSGKTTLARIIAAMVADEFFVSELDASTLTIQAVQGLERDSGLSTWCPDRPGRVFIVNEAHGLRQDCVRQLLVTLERIPAGAAWIFTTTSDGNSRFESGIDGKPLISRCLPLQLGVDHRAFAEHLQRVADREGLDGQDLRAYQRLLHECGGNMRQAIQRIELGEMAVAAVPSVPEPIKAIPDILPMDKPKQPSVVVSEPPVRKPIAADDIFGQMAFGKAG